MAQLHSKGFLRVHRSCIQNTARTVSLTLRRRRRFVVVDGFEQELPVARSQVKAGKEAMGRAGG